MAAALPTKRAAGAVEPKHGLVPDERGQAPAAEAEVPDVPWPVEAAAAGGGRIARLEVLRKGAKVYAASFSPDGKFLALGSDDKTQTACILAAPEDGAGDWAVVAQLKLHHHKAPPSARYVKALAFSPDGKWLALAAGTRP